MIRTYLKTLGIFSVTLMLLALSGADSVAAEEGPVKVVLHPAKEAKPALKYQLLPPFKEWIQGNAAVYYGKVTAEETFFFGSSKIREQIHEWEETPLAKLRDPSVQVRLGQASLDNLRRGARCTSCDWQLPIHEVEFYSIMLGEIQQTRQFARILHAKARIHIARGEFNDAIETLQTCYGLAGHVSKGATIIGGLVAAAIASMTSAGTLEFIQQREAPNLYWALTMLPRPMIDLRECMQTEMNAAELSFTEVRNLDRPRSPEEWRNSLESLWTKVMGLTVDGRPDNAAARLAIALQGYPQAKQGLIERGMSELKVEAMPVAQVILLYSIQVYEELRDEVFKTFYLPYVESTSFTRMADKRVKRAKMEGLEIIPLAEIILPSMEVVRNAQMRADRQIAVLRVLEALRIYGAEHGGLLPARLEEITQVPVPKDPVTDQPFFYRLDDGTAYLQGPSLPGNPLNYEISMGRE